MNNEYIKAIIIIDDYNIAKHLDCTDIDMIVEGDFAYGTLYLKCAYTPEFPLYFDDCPKQYDYQKHNTPLKPSKGKHNV